MQRSVENELICESRSQFYKEKNLTKLTFYSNFFLKEVKKLYVSLF